MIKPQALKKGDKVAVVSLSSGMLGESQFIHKFDIAKKRLHDEFGLELVAMPNALKGKKFIYEHPEARAQDMMDAFKDKSIKAIICAIGGIETYRLLPYIDFDVLKNNPKIFMGFSDTTVNHFMLYKAGVASFYGPIIMCNFGEYVKMFDYEVQAVKDVLFNNSCPYEIKSSPVWSDDFVPWDEKNANIQKKTKKETHGYEVLQGHGKVRGRLLGGCLDSLSALLGVYEEDWYPSKEVAENQVKLAEKYGLFPNPEEWKGKILFVEVSEDCPTPEFVRKALHALADNGVIENISGIIVGKPMGEKYYEEYKQVFKQVIGEELKRPDLPIIYNVNFGHAMPINIIPYGAECELDCENKKITVLEKMLEPVKENSK